MDYDCLNNPVRIQFTDGNVTRYVYSATGEKLRVVYQTAVPNITVAIGSTRELMPSEILFTDSTDYLLGGALMLKNGRIDKFLFEEGYCQATRYNATQDNFTFLYYDRDHLGNVRQVTKAMGSTGTVVQTMNYYPFGAQFCGGTANNNDIQPYKYNGKELDKMHGLNTYDYGARQYNPITARWDRVDPLAEKYYPYSPYVYCMNNPMNAIDPDGKDGVYIVFPDYKISTPVGKLSGLGHAGVLLIDNKSGFTKYYEYGRYDAEGKGLVRTQTVPNVIIGNDGKPTQESLNKTLSTISDKAGQGGRIEGAYIKSDDFDIMNNYAIQRMEDNNNENRRPYSLTSNNCGTFAKDVLEADPKVKEQTPLIIDPRPVSIVEEFQDNFERIYYNKK